MPSLIERFEVDPALRLATGLQEPGVRSRAVLRESTLMSNTENPSLVAQEPSSFEVAVRDRSWDWLLELRRRLKVDLLLVDSRPSVLLPTLTDQAARLSAMLEHGEGACCPQSVRRSRNARPRHSISAGCKSFVSQ